MLITDGAVEGYEPVFKKYNWPDRKVTGSRGKWGLSPASVDRTVVGQPQVQGSFPLGQFINSDIS